MVLSRKVASKVAKMVNLDIMGMAINF